MYMIEKNGNSIRFSTTELFIQHVVKAYNIDLELYPEEFDELDAESYLYMDGWETWEKIS